MSAGAAQVALRPPLRVVCDAAVVDLDAAEDAAADFLRALGLSTDTEALRETPRRMAAAYAEMLTPRAFDLTTFPNDEGYDELVLARAIPVRSVCEHHLLPFVGVAHVGYLPGDRILGLSKLARVVELFARAPAGPGAADQAGRRLARTTQLGAARRRRRHRGRAPVHDAARRPRRAGTRTVTSTLLGALRDDPRSRAEFLALARRHDRRRGQAMSRQTDRVRDRRRRAGRRQGRRDAARARASTATSIADRRRGATCPYERPPLSKGYLARHRRRGTRSSCTTPAGTPTTTSTCAPATARSTARPRRAHGHARRRRAVCATTSCCSPPARAPRRSTCPARDLDGVHYLRTLADCDRLARGPRGRRPRVGDRRRRLDRAGGRRRRPRRAARGHRRRGGRPAAAAACSGRSWRGVFADLHRGHGVDLRSARGRASIARRRRGVGAVVARRRHARSTPTWSSSASASRPTSSSPSAAGLDVDNGVLVDARLRTCDPDIFAAGDVANAVPPAARPARPRRALGQRAQRQGRPRPRTCSARTSAYDRLPYFFTDQYDLGMEYVGYASPTAYDQVVVRGDLDAAREFIAFWLARRPGAGRR